MPSLTTTTSSTILLLLLASVSTTTAFRTPINHHISASHQHVPRQTSSQGYTAQQVASDICAANPTEASDACNTQQLAWVNAMAKGYCDLTAFSVEQCQGYGDSDYGDAPGCEQELANEASCNQVA